MAYTVWRIDTIPSATNEFTTGRTETWTLKKDCEFGSFDEARVYVEAQNRSKSELPRLLVGISEEEKRAVVDEFCFGNKYLHLARYFLGKPDEGKIAVALKGEGINVVSAK